MMLSSALLVAFAIDALWGEPKARWHPVVWMGQYLSFTGTRCAPLVAHNTARAHGGEFARGMRFWCLGALVCVLFAVGVQQLVAELPSWAAIALLAVTLKPLFAWRMLVQEVQAVEAALNQSLAAGRERLALLCSRDVSQLNDAQVRETALETLAENLNDSLVAPLFWFVLLGLPGAALYRFANTADAMWGYRGERSGRDWTWAGKFAARADDVLSWLPARITAALLVACAGGDISFQNLRREAHKTPSPNSGWPMAAAALALGVHLSKHEVYSLNTQGQKPQTQHVVAAIKLCRSAAMVCVVLCFAVLSLLGL